MGASRKKRRRSILLDILITVLFLTGAGIMSYPYISDWLNSRNMTRVVVGYGEAVQGLTEEECREILGAARDYNRRLKENPNPFSETSRTEGYDEVFRILDYVFGTPYAKSHLKAEDILIPDETDKAQRPKAQSNYRVLVVDDDVEIGTYIQQELGIYYKVTPVTSGREALRLLLGAEEDRQFDLVVSDVMMPEMDGFTMLRLIKTNMNISHIPVVMLTSKSDVANRLEGLEKGADAFLAKPFDMDELHVIINNLISKNLRLKGKFSGVQQQKDKVVETKVKGNDEVLMERIMKVVNDHLSDSDFNVEVLTKEVGISRAQLHRKMKEMTGLPISEFIRNIRLEQAVRLLKEQKINVTQVAYTVGFSNLAHFSTVFRKQFGVSPTEYIEQNLQEETKMQ